MSSRATTPTPPTPCAALGRTDEAIADLGQAIAICEHLVQVLPAVAAHRMYLAYTLRRLGLARRATGDTSAAVADTRRAAYEGLTSRSADDWFDLACCHALLAGMAGQKGSGVPARDAGPEAEKTMALLRRAVADGYRDLDAFRTEAGPDALRPRPDFRLLMLDLSFPVQPFAQKRG